VTYTPMQTVRVRCTFEFDAAPLTVQTGLRVFGGEGAAITTLR
jgi:hypothetical protein